jgi:hypothetical protein
MGVIDLYLLQDEWASIVRKLKESEKDGYTTERLARAILRHIENVRIRQYNLFTQRRGEDFDMMLAKLEDAGFDLQHIRRLIDDEDFWTTTLELAE